MKIGFLIALLALTACTSPHGFDDALNAQDGKTTSVIWDEDTRTDIETADTDLELAQATALLVQKHRLTEKDDGSFQAPSNPLRTLFPLCQDEKFLDQDLLGHCSGVLISPNVLLTAGHCVKAQEDCDLVYITFGRTQEKAKMGSLSKDEIYTCKRILKSVSTLAKDFAFIELDRDVTQALPVKTGKANDLKDQAPVLSLSYPLGLPLKKDTGAILKSEPNSNFLRVKVDTFAGSSGSPLFNSKKELVGILSTGSEDFKDDKEGFQRHFKNGTCMQAVRCAEDSCFGERYMKTEIIGF